MAAAKKAGIADLFGVPEGNVKGTFVIGAPDDPEAARRQHEREVLRDKLNAGLAAGSLFAAVAITWLALHYGKADFAEKVAVATVTMVGGFLAGRSTAPKD